MAGQSRQSQTRVVVPFSASLFVAPHLGSLTVPINPVVHVIDDDDAARDSLSFLLGTAEFTVRAYDSAKAFLNIASTVQVGCIITDVRMPEMYAPGEGHE